MQVIKTPMSKLDKVKHLLKIANELKILDDNMFDILMDKYEDHYVIFDMMMENINYLIVHKTNIECTKKIFLRYLKTNNIGEIMMMQMFDLDNSII